MPECKVIRTSRMLVACLAMSVMINLCGCSKPTSPAVMVIQPPAVLMEACPEPGESGEVLELLRVGNTEDAAVAYVRYVLDVRDAFQLCNGQLSAIRDYSASMAEGFK